MNEETPQPGDVNGNTGPMLMSTNQIRQVLFNELGLTREFVREMVKEIVGATCEKFFKSGQFESWLIKQIDNQLRTYHYGSGELKSAISAAVAETIKKEITSKLTLTVSGSIGGAE